MNLKHYMIFREVAKTENFTKAADNLFLTQSAVSHAMKDLEEQAGTRLFERLHKSVKLTTCGELLLAELLPILESFEKLDNRMKDMEQEAPIQIASCITIAKIWLPRIIKDFQQCCPKVPVYVTVNSAANSLEALKKGEADLAFIEGNIAQGAFLTKTFASYELWAAAAPSYDAKDSMSFRQLMDYPLLLRERGSAVREVLESIIIPAGYQPLIQWTSVDSQSLIAAARAGFGITILPRVLLEPEIRLGTLKQIEISDLALCNHLTLAVNKTKYQTRSLKKLWEMI